MSDNRLRFAARFASVHAARALLAGLAAVFLLFRPADCRAQSWFGSASSAAAGASIFPASARSGAASQTPHPAVVRVIAPERDGASLGSGTLVDVSATHGLVITNWHVVRDAAGNVIVSFPDGFQTPGYVIKTDKDWDLAAVAIWRPRVAPVPISTQPPRPGDVLTIAGYGPGPYRALSGRCTEYLSPGAGFPYEIVELHGAARHGDSGGPIFNSRGELAGVLFGEGGGDTSGSYCGRVRVFLDSIGAVRAPQLPANTLAAAPPPRVTSPAARPTTDVGLLPVPQWTGAPAKNEVAVSSPSTVTALPPVNRLPVTAAIPAPTATSRAAAQPQSVPRAFAASSSSVAGSAPGDNLSRVEPFTWEDFAGHTLGEQLKTILACAGIILLLLQVVRWVA